MNRVHLALALELAPLGVRVNEVCDAVVCLAHCAQVRA